MPIAPFSIFGIVFSLEGNGAAHYLIGLVAMMFTALSCREMSRAFPIAGSVRVRGTRHFANGRFSGRLGDSS